MLKVLRDNLKSLHWVLWLVVGVMVVFVFAQWGGGGQFAGTGAMNAAAEVGSETISIGEFRRAYEQTEERYRQSIGESFTPELARQMQLPLIVLGQLVDRQILLQEARDAGLRVGDEELRRTILEMPFFQDQDGNWAGEEIYRRVLRSNGYNVESFQAALRNDLLIQKLRTTVRRSAFVSPEEIEAEYRRQNETATIRYLALPASQVEAPSPTPEEIASYYQAHPEEFRLPVRRTVDYLQVDQATLASELQLGEDDLRAWYEEHRAEFTTQEQVRARHILLRTGEERTAREARERLEAVRASVREGEEFAAKAAEISEDPGSRAQGGDLGWFGRDEMVSAFSDAAFGASPGEMVIAETPFGIHLIQVLERRPGGTQPFEQVREQVTRRLRAERGEEGALRRAEELVRRLGANPDAETMQRLATETAAVRFTSTEPFGRDDYVPDIGRSNAFTEAAFESTLGQVTGPVRLSGGPAVLVPREELPSAVPPLEEIRDEVRRTAQQNKRLEVARQRLERVRTELREGTEFDAAATELGLEAEEAGPFGRGQPVGGLGDAPAVAEAAMRLAEGELGGPVTVEDAAVLFQVTERVRIDPQEFAAARQQLGAQMAERRTQELLNSRLSARKKELEVHYNNQLLANFGLGPLAEPQSTATG